MSVAIGAAVNDVLTETDRNQGKTLKPGNLVTDGTGNVYIQVKATASQNIINGNVVYWDGSNNATIMPSGPGTPASPGVMMNLGIAVCSVTASASQFFFAQIFGQGNVRVTNLTASNLPNHLMVMGSTDGEVKALSGTASLYISGLVLTATASTATLAACFINFPRIAMA